MKKYIKYVLLVLIQLLIFSCEDAKKENKHRKLNSETSTEIDLKKETVVERDSFKLLTSYFETGNRRIPDELVNQYLKLDQPYEGYYSTFYSVDSINFKELIYLIVKISCTAGSMCENQQLYVFNTEDFVSSISIGGEQGDDTFEFKTHHEFINDTVIQLSSYRKEYKVDFEAVKFSRDLILDTINYSYVEVMNSGKINRIENEPSINRKYSHSSYRIYDFDYFKKLDREERDIFRNEIFADYGYIFETEKWKNYFASKNWYNPKTKEVNRKMSPIELENIRRILSLE